MFYTPYNPDRLGGGTAGNKLIFGMGREIFLQSRAALRVLMPDDKLPTERRHREPLRNF
jgi:hypothetical protein